MPPKGSRWGPGRRPAMGWEFKTTPRATVSPTTTDLAWAAGFLEGEGCFAASVKAAQKQRWPLDRLQALFGGSIRPHGQADIWNWNVSGSRARGVMMTIFVFLSPRRRDQVRRVLIGGTL